MLDGLPKEVLDLIRCSFNVEFATVTKDGVPIDTPLLLFYPEDLSTLDVATGVAYPAKAERARRNPKVGMLIDGRSDEPVISIAGLAAVADADIQANALQYMKETSSYGSGDSQPWSVARHAYWYWARIFIRTTPKRILWWDSPDAMDKPPHRWVAPPDTSYPASDPAPAGSPSVAPKWPQPQWREWAATFLERNVKGCLTMLDEEGYPLPIRARGVKLVDDGFALDMPACGPWAGEGRATLDFEGRGTFVGHAVVAGPRTHLRVERILPVLPLVRNPVEVWLPEPDTKAQLVARLQHELDRRGLPIPTIPAVKPDPTEGALLRKERRKLIVG